jgi:hypothetical protein
LPPPLTPHHVALRSRAASYQHVRSTGAAKLVRILNWIDFNTVQGSR